MSDNSHIARAFNRFVERQIRAGDVLEMGPGARLRPVGLPPRPGETIPEVLYDEGRVGVRYLSFPYGLELQLRMFGQEAGRAPEDGPTKLYTSYTYSKQEGELVMADEITARHRDNPSSQTLARLLSVPLFRRELVVDSQGFPRQVLGPQEFAALGKYLVGHELH